MSRRMKMGALVVWAGVAALTGCGSENEAAQTAVTETPRRTTNVRVYRVQPDTLTLVSRLPATVHALRKATLSFQEAGTVIAATRDLGDVVRAGEILARLDDDLLRAAATEAEAGLKFQKYNYDRSKQLFEDGTISEQDFFSAEYQWKRAESAAATIRERLARATLRAPFAGVIASRRVQAGDLVQPGVAVFDIVQSDTVKVEAWVPETDVADFEPGRSVVLHLEAFPGRPFSGTVDRIGPAADPERRVFPIEVVLVNEDGVLRDGMIGRLEAVRRTYHDVMVVPREAVQQRQNGPVAFIQEAGEEPGSGVARVRALTLGHSEGNRVIVLDGIRFGERVIVAGARDLFEGEQVTVQGGSE